MLLIFGLSVENIKQFLMADSICICLIKGNVNCAFKIFRKKNHRVACAHFLARWFNLFDS